MTTARIITGAPLRPHALSAMDAVWTVFQSAQARHILGPVYSSARKPAKWNYAIAATNPRCVAPARCVVRRSDPTLARNDDTTLFYRRTLETVA